MYTPNDSTQGKYNQYDIHCIIFNRFFHILATYKIAISNNNFHASTVITALTTRILCRLFHLELFRTICSIGTTITTIPNNKIEKNKSLVTANCISFKVPAP